MTFIRLPQFIHIVEAKVTQETRLHYFPLHDFQTDSMWCDWSLSGRSCPVVLAVGP